jgi:hypothetical protein
VHVKVCCMELRSTDISMFINFVQIEVPVTSHEHSGMDHAVFAAENTHPELTTNSPHHLPRQALPFMILMICELRGIQMPPTEETGEEAQ